MGATIQRIRDAETEAQQLEKVLRSVGITLRANSKQTGKAGITYAEFKARTLKGVKAVPANGRA